MCTQKKSKESFFCITKIYLQFGYWYYQQEISKSSTFLSRSFLVSINFHWEHKGEYDKEYTPCGYYSQQQRWQLSVLGIQNSKVLQNNQIV